MAAEEHLNKNQFVEVYRGLHNDNYDIGAFTEGNQKRLRYAKEGLGIHWTADPNVAESYASGEAQALPHHHYIDMGLKGPEGVVLRALVHPDHIVQPGTDEWHKLSKQHGIMDERDAADPAEKEVTVMGPVHVQEVYRVKGHPVDKEAGIYRIGKYHNLKIKPFKGHV